MLKNIINFYRVSQPKPCNEESLSEQKQRLKRFQWSTFLAATLGYGMYYVCRLSLNVVKKPIVDEGVFSETELGIIGAVLFFTYAVGKFMNGFLADRSNINRFMSTGLLVTALVNLCLGFVHSFILFAVLWGISGWFQSMGAASCVVGLSRWFTDKERGSYYGFWSASHNIGEALTFLIVASIVSVLGWRYGFFGAGIVGLLGALIVWKFFHDTPESQGFPPVNAPKQKEEMSVVETTDFNKAQRQVLMMPAIWILALSSAFMYISRYAINSWGVFYLEAQKGYSTLERNSCRPSFDICGIWGGYMEEGSKTVLPSKAYAKVSCRLVPHQDHGKISKLFEEYIARVAPAYVKVRVTPKHGGQGYVCPIDLPAYKAAEEAVAVAFGKRPLAVRRGGSIPIISTFEQVLGIKTVLMGFGLEQNAIHSPNESCTLDFFYKGIESVAEFYKRFN